MRRLFALGVCGAALMLIAGTATPVHPVVHEDIAAAPSGGWTWFQEPRAVQYNGVVYFGYVNGSGDIAIRTINATTLAVSAETVLHAALEADDHDNPTILIRDSDKRIIVFYTRHGGAQMYKRVSTNPEDISAFDAEVDLDASLGGAAYTYPSPVQLLSEANDPIWLFYRDPVDDNTTAMRYSKSTDGGATWAAQTLLYSDSGRSAYWKVTSDGLGRIDFAVSDGHPFYDATVKIGHFYYEGGTFYQTDGSAFVGAPPYDFTDVSEIYAGSPKGWVWDVAVDSVTGYPRVTYSTWPSKDDARLHWARWTGTAWESHEVATGGSKDFAQNQSYYTGGIVLDHEDTNVVYCSREIDGQYEMWRYTTADNGSTWTGEQLTFRSGGINIRPVSIRNHGANLAALWLYAPYYAGYLTYSAGTRGAAP